MRRSRAVLLVVLVLAGINGCSAEESQQDPLVGMWTTNLKGIYVAFNADGTYGKGLSPEAALDPEKYTLSGIDWGTWTVEDGILTFNTSEGTNYCSGDIGTYQIEITEAGDQILVTLIDDTCAKREVDFPSGLTSHTDT